jgi:hypothetical protein
MDAGVEDRIVVESERAAQSGRAGVIEEVLAQDPPRFRVRWDDGRTSIFAPSAGVARIERRKKKRVKAWSTGSRRGGTPAARYFPRDFFFCFFTFKLGIGAFAWVPRETGLGPRCFFDFPAMPILLDRGRVATDDPTLQAVTELASNENGRVRSLDRMEP